MGLVSIEAAVGSGGGTDKEMMLVDIGGKVV